MLNVFAFPNFEETLFFKSCIRVITCT